MAAIYQIRNTINNKLYIGSSISPLARRNQHWSKLNKNEHGNPRLQEEWNQFGAGSFVFEIVNNLGKVSEEELEELEQAYLDIYFGKDTCYNINPQAERHYKKDKGGVKTQAQLFRNELLNKARDLIKDKTKCFKTRSAKKPCVMISPDGEKYLVINRTTFAKHFGLHPDVLTKMLSTNPKWKRFKSCKGWTGYRIGKQEISSWKGKVWNFNKLEVWS